MYILTVGRGLAPADKATVTLSIYGNIIKEEIEKIHERYSCAKISNYIIMPDHIHLILVMRYREEYAAGASPRPTVMDIICALKSIITRRCKAIGYINKRLFQTSFYEHIIRNKNDFDEIVYYIKSNPERRCKKQAAKENRNDR